MKKIYKIDNVVHGLNRIRTDTPARHLSRIIHSLIMRWLMRMSVYFLLTLLQYSEPVQRERDNALTLTAFMRVFQCRRMSVEHGTK